MAQNDTLYGLFDNTPRQIALFSTYKSWKYVIRTMLPFISLEAHRMIYAILFKSMDCIITHRQTLSLFFHRACKYILKELGSPSKAEKNTARSFTPEGLQWFYMDEEQSWSSLESKQSLGVLKAPNSYVKRFSVSV